MTEIIKRLKIKKIVYKGFGLGFFDSNPIFVLHALPDEIVDVRILYKKKNSYFAEIVRFWEKSKFRLEPKCEAFGKCGGCDWLQIDYRQQLEFKNEIMKEIYSRVKIPSDFFIIPSSQPYFYRNKSFLPVADNNKNPLIGMFARQSHQVVPHEKCWLQPEIFSEISKVFLTYLKSAKVPIYNEKTKRGNLRFIGFRINDAGTEILVIPVTKSGKLPFTKQLVKLLTQKFPQIVGIIQNINPKVGNKILGERDKILFGNAFLNVNISGKKFKLHYQAFSQVNFAVGKAMYEFIRKHISENTNIIDAYSGAGTIGIFVSDLAKKVFLIENNSFACADASENIFLNNVKNTEVIEGNVEHKISEVLENHRIDVIIFDPPRKGLEKSIIKKVSQRKIKKIIYAGCDPTTQHRDVNLFLKNGYEIKVFQPFDMFPQTFHIENVIVLELP